VSIEENGSTYLDIDPWLKSHKGARENGLARSRLTYDSESLITTERKAHATNGRQGASRGVKGGREIVNNEKFV
jgi:hypothetical protein